VTCSNHPDPIGREVEDAELPGWRPLWYEVIHLFAHLRATPEEGGVAIWEVAFQKNPVIKQGHQL